MDQQDTRLTDESIGKWPSRWLAIAEAARATGWNPERLRWLARRGTIVTRRGNRGIEILIEEGRPRTSDGQPLTEDRPPPRPPKSDDDADQIQRLESLVERLRSDLARAERESGDLRVDLARAEERAKAIEAVARSDVEAGKRVVEAELAAREEVLAELRTQVAREATRGDALGAELAELRQPWWRRLWP
jgi:predicted RNase H-like nuclease (RuvC/YqgF family)